MTVYHWVCRNCEARVYSPDIPQVGMNLLNHGRDSNGEYYHATQEDVDAAYDEYDAAIAAHACEDKEATNA